MDVITLGEALIDFFAVKSGVSLAEADEFRKVAGGAPANVAVGVSKLGLKASFIGRVGDDEFGRFLEKTLIENGVDTSQVQFDSRVRTGLAFIAVPTPNTREFLFYRSPSADMMLDWKEFDENVIKDTKILHFGSITLIGEPSKTSTYEAVKMAKSAGAIISYDPNLRLHLWPNSEEAKKMITQAIPLSDVIKLNNEELYFITGKKSIEDMRGAMDELLSLGPKLCVVTMGEMGCSYATKRLFGYIPSFKVNAVDTTGCGDSFVAGLLTGILKEGSDLFSNNRKIVRVLKFASAAAAITSLKKGVIPALPFREDVEKFLQKDNNRFKSK